MTTISPEPTHAAAPAARLLLFLCLFGAAVPEQAAAQQPSLPPVPRPPTPTPAAGPASPAAASVSANGPVGGVPTVRVFSARLGEDLSMADVLGGGDGHRRARGGRRLGGPQREDAHDERHRQAGCVRG